MPTTNKKSQHKILIIKEPKIFDMNTLKQNKNRVEENKIIAIHIHKNHPNLHRAVANVNNFIHKNTVLVIAIALAAVTSVIVPPGKEYIGYFDFKTLCCLFCTLAVVCALKNIRFFTKIAEKVVSVSGNTRIAAIVLVYITFIGSMFLANDMALLTFLPLGFYVFSSCGKEKYMAFVFIMQNIAANLGGMLTPFGNPQNLYLYEKFSIGNGEFVCIMLFPFMLSIAMITVMCVVFIKPEKAEIKSRDYTPLPTAKCIAYLILFALSVLLVFRIVPYYIGFAIVLVSLLLLDRNALGKVDYCLLLTFCAFFVFAGNMARIEFVKNFLASLLEKDVLLVSAFSCQLISNVPTAILLSNFTDNYRELLLGVNIGGTGTLIASLASLITFREYTSRYPENTKKYLLLFTTLNVFFLVTLILFTRIIL